MRMDRALAPPAAIDKWMYMSCVVCDADKLLHEFLDEFFYDF